VGLNNADLPEAAWRHENAPLPATADLLDARQAEDFVSIFKSHRILLAPTHFSATAPLKLAAREHGFRAATMPGFNPAMIPALRLNYTEINRRVFLLKDLLDRATGASLLFCVEDHGDCSLELDLRHRTATPSGGLFPNPGSAGNLPSGETYIVPYEGELPDDPSRSAGRLPVQFGEEVVLYEIAQNRAVQVEGSGAMAESEADRLQQEPAYGNLAELGLGVLADFGLQPTGEILLDEKLGLHIAFGRSDHFGGQVGAKDFSSPDNVVHIDRVYLPAIQPRVRVRFVKLIVDAAEMDLIRDDRYVIDFGSP
jgi:leucyl aminopeptidase (aminopeptidase T)